MGWSLGAIVNLFLGLGPGWGFGLISAILIQWLVLRQHFHRTHWWVIVSFATWVVGIGSSFGVPQSIGFVVFLSAVVPSILVGITSGIVMIWLLDEHPKDTDS
ncbi:MAG: hypothetical protein IH840_15000 [Candidatus Heimdallarchaeota archaeon]|nr:hypothetical protein [Candidatus Heimdallarchaeota archaeon]